MSPSQIQSQFSEVLAQRSGKLFTLPPLPYEYAGLEPHVDAETMKVHYEGHHAQYVQKLNEAIAGAEQAKGSLEEIFSKISTWPSALRNNGGGHWNHSFFWTLMTDNEDLRQIPPDLEARLNKSFGSLNVFKESFTRTAEERFGSGWVWLIVDPRGKLEITSTPNQDNPLMDVVEKRGRPLFACDLWEHAYYLKHENKRKDYLKDFWKVVNWFQVRENFSKAGILNVEDLH